MEKTLDTLNPEKPVPERQAIKILCWKCDKPFLNAIAQSDSQPIDRAEPKKIAIQRSCPFCGALCQFVVAPEELLIEERYRNQNTPSDRKKEFSDLFELERGALQTEVFKSQQPESEQSHG